MGNGSSDVFCCGEFTDSVSRPADLRHSLCYLFTDPLLNDDEFLRTQGLQNHPGGGMKEKYIHVSLSTRLRIAIYI